MVACRPALPQRYQTVGHESSVAMDSTATQLFLRAGLFFPPVGLENSAEVCHWIPQAVFSVRRPL